ncbi:hypothetical protein B0T25DRAFT_563719 [Lasiosphaeria hispida]|uniref:Uncharacterized protein n=1 Tax=Lasiosphaeria hispida TaxID=260671 RepID=A0AAJ0HXI2_9PEZI|nr:hypothetical protein B0T25DRAFT_563719 [Lasiosphaeria hispida]
MGRIWSLLTDCGNKQWTSTTPQGLAPGNYLIRHECAQVVVTGSGTATPDTSYKAAIPGYCKDSDANIKVPINNCQIPHKYAIPRPPIFKGTGAKRVGDFTASKSHQNILTLHTNVHGL